MYIGSLYSLTLLFDHTLSKQVGEKLFPKEHLKMYFFNKIGCTRGGGCFRGIISGIMAVPLAPETSRERKLSRVLVAHQMVFTDAQTPPAPRGGQCWAFILGYSCRSMEPVEAPELQRSVLPLVARAVTTGAQCTPKSSFQVQQCMC